MYIIRQLEEDNRKLLIQMLNWNYIEKNLRIYQLNKSRKIKLLFNKYYLRKIKKIDNLSNFLIIFKIKYIYWLIFNKVYSIYIIIYKTIEKQFCELYSLYIWISFIFMNRNE